MTPNLIQNGTRPNIPSHLDFDFLKSKHPRVFMGIQAMPEFPPEYLTDAGVTMPDQNTEGMPDGCTNFAQRELVINLLKGLDFGEYTVAQIEAVTHANARGGIQIRESLEALLPPSYAHPERLGWISAFYNVIAHGTTDYFDTFRFAQYSGIPEERSLSVGFPWFPSFSAAAAGNLLTYNPLTKTFTYSSGGTKKSIMPMPMAIEFEMIQKNPNAFPWHDSVQDGWTSKFGPVLYRDKSFQGSSIGDGGFLYFDRATINALMAIPQTVAFTATRSGIGIPQRIDLPFIQYLLSQFRNLFGLSY